MRITPRAWAIWVAGGLASFAALELYGYKDGETLTSQITRLRDSHPLARAAIAASLGAAFGFAADHLLHHPSPSDAERARRAGL